MQLIALRPGFKATSVFWNSVRESPGYLWTFSSRTAGRREVGYLVALRNPPVQFECLSLHIRVYPLPHQTPRRRSQPPHRHHG